MGQEIGCCLNSKVSSINKLPTNLFLLSFVSEDEEFWKLQDEILEYRIKQSNTLDKKINYIQQKLIKEENSQNINFQKVDLIIAQLAQQINYNGTKIEKIHQTESFLFQRNSLKIEQLEQICNQLQENLQIKNKQIENYTDLVQNIQKTIKHATLQLQYQEQESQIKQLKFDKQLSELQAQLLKTKELNDFQQTENQNIFQRLQSEKESKKQLQDQLFYMQNEIQSQQLQLEDLQTKLKKVNKRYTKEQLKVQNSVQKETKLQQTLQKKENEIDTLNETFQKDQTNYKQQILRLENQLEKEKSRTQELLNELQETQLLVEQEKQQIAQTMSQLVEQQYTAEEKIKQIKQMNAQISQMNYLLEKEQILNKELTTKEQKLQQQLYQKESQIETLAEHLKGEIQSNQQNYLLTLNEERSKFKLNIENLQTENQKMKITLQNEKQKSQEQLQELIQSQKENKAQMQEILKLKTQIELLNDQLEKEQQQVETLNNKERKMESLIQQKEIEIQSLKIEYQQSLQNSKLNFEAEKEILQNQISEQKSQYSKSLNENQTIQQKLQEEQISKLKVQEKILITQTENEKLSNQIQDLNVLLQQANQQISKEKQNNEKLSQKDEEQIINLKNQEKEIYILKQNLQEKQEYQEKLQLINQSYQTQIKELTLASSEKENLISQIKFQLQDKVSESETQENKINELQQLTKELIQEEQKTQTQFKESQKSLQNERQLVKQLQEKLQEFELQSKQGEIKNQISEKTSIELNLQILQLKQQVEKEQIQYEENIKNIKNQYELYKNELLSSSKQEQDNLNKQIQILKQLVGSSQKQDSDLNIVRQLQSQVNELQNQNKEKEEAISNLSDQLNSKIQEYVLKTSELERQLQAFENQSQDTSPVKKRSSGFFQESNQITQNILLQSIEGIQNEKPMGQSGIWKIFDNLMDNKFKQDQQDIQSGFKPKNMPSYLIEILLQQYGVKNIAFKTLAQLLLGLNQLQKEGSQYAILFCRLLQVYHPSPADLAISIFLAKVRNEFIKLQEICSKKMQLEQIKKATKQVSAGSKKQEEGGDAFLIDVHILLYQLFQEDKQLMQSLFQSLIPQQKEDFLIALFVQKVQKYESVNQLYQIIDNQGNGSISSEQLQNELITLGFIKEETEIFQQNFQGNISQKEFINRVTVMQSRNINRDQWLISKALLLITILDFYESQKKQNFESISQIFNQHAQSGFLSKQKIQEITGLNEVKEELGLTNFQHLMFYKNIKNFGLKSLESQILIDGIEKIDEVQTKKKSLSRQGSLRKKK